MYKRQTLNTRNKEEYTKVAEEINNDKSVKLVHIQHEFGLFGGNYGDYLLDFLNVIKKPLTYTFHSVIPNPNQELKTFVKLLLSCLLYTSDAADDQINVL